MYGNYVDKHRIDVVISKLRRLPVWFCSIDVTKSKQGFNHSLWIIVFIGCIEVGDAAIAVDALCSSVFPIGCIYFVVNNQL